MPPALPPRIPRATYRVQLNAGFTFAQLTAIVPYLAALGVSHLYCSPYFRSRAGSQHGYDVVDHNAFDPEIGIGAEFDALVSALRAHGMGHVLDIVPNHVGIMGADNEWWMDVLENGPASPWAPFFDIDWSPPGAAMADRLLVPVLGEPYGAVLERGELELRFESARGAFAVYYHEHRFPLDPSTYPRVLDRVLAHASSAELENVRRGFATLRPRHGLDAGQVTERHVSKGRHQQSLAQLAAAEPRIAQAIDAAIASLEGTVDEPASFDSLDELLQAQAWRLAWWRVAADDINYRRFFDVNDLAALRVDRPEVFEATHRKLLELVGAGKIDGLRVDHVDGLYDPAGYVRRLQQRVGEVLGHEAPGAAQAAAGNGARLPIYLVVEKITAAFEHLPDDWPVHGETGYHFANVVNRMLVDGGTSTRMEHVYRAFIGERPEWSAIAYECQHLVMRSALAAEVNTIAQRLTGIAQADRRTRDFSYNALRRAVAEVIACFPVYRTYIVSAAAPDDRRYIDWAVTAARRHRPASEGPVFEFLRAALLLELPAASADLRREMCAFVMKFQQVTAPVTAKGIEDTALYRYGRLVSLNEVGGEPDGYGLSVGGFHADAQYRARHWPHELLATSTHDTKRSEDVRARIDVLSECIVPWRRALDRWSRMNRTRRRTVAGEPAPSRNDEYVLYQTLLGTWPLEGGIDDDYRERIAAYMLKAAREAKLRTSWATPDAEYEEALTQFVRGVLDTQGQAPFVTDIGPFALWLARFGLLNALSQTLLKLTAPGVPDIYQGNELWDFSLVDPDNRRPVDYAARARQLAKFEQRGAAWGAADCRELLGSLHDGRAKLFVSWRALALRRERPELFERGHYQRLRVTGRHAANVCAFAREHEEQRAIVVAPRLYRRLLGNPDPPAAPLPLGPEVWGDTRIELSRPMRKGTSLRNQLDGTELTPEDESGSGPARLPLGRILLHFPVALLSA